MTGMIGLDFETYGSVSLPDHGLARYTADKFFTPLIGSTAFRATGGKLWQQRYDFISDRRGSKRDLTDALTMRDVVAHNAGFEQAVLDVIGIEMPTSRFIDSAVVARIAGAGGRLEQAAPQLLDQDKMKAGKNLIKLFSIPGKYQEESGDGRFDPRIIEDNILDWITFKEYCDLDAEQGLRIVEEYLHWLTPAELDYMHITQDMNRTGWCIDIDLVEEMQRRYLENLDVQLERFRRQNNAADLNLNSLKQMKAWCGERGIRANSFAEKKVVQLKAVIEKKISSMASTDPRFEGYVDVLALLSTKQALGGSSLKKLKVMIDTSSGDSWSNTHRLKDQYLHAGAGQTLRTTGRSVQMQNLKQLDNEHLGEMAELYDMAVDWDNDKLAANIRQLFTASVPAGKLIVGDFKSVESRGLAWLAGEQWKLDAYRAGLDVYKKQAELIYGVQYDVVTKDQRQGGKLGELSCGYGAGGGAVRDFGAKLGIEITEGEATKLVYDWRDANPMTVAFWLLLNDMLLTALHQGESDPYQLPDGFSLRFSQVETPASLVRMHPSARSIMMCVLGPDRQPWMKRVFHGCYVRGRNVGYYKPSDRKTGDVWTNHFTDQKTKQVRFYELYGGKLAGILTQSVCRQLFMQCLADTARWCRTTGGQIQLVGQFHDEIVLDWQPGVIGLGTSEHNLARYMSNPGAMFSFPLEADIKHDYRYIK